MGDRVEEVSGGDEVSITNGLYRMLNTGGRTIYFTAGHGEYDLYSTVSEDHLEGEGEHDRPIFIHEARGLGKLREQLELMGHSVEELFLQTGQPVPDDADLVVVVSPSEVFPPESLNALRNYLAGGGKLLAMLDGFRDGGLGQVLSDYGIVPQNDLVVDFGNHFWNDATAPATGRYTRHPVTERLPLTFYPGTQSLRVADNLPDHINVTTLFSSTARSMAVSSPEQLEQLRTLDLPVQSYDLMMISEAGTGSDRTKIAVIGDGDVGANEYLSLMGNQRLLSNTINWLMGADDRLDLPAATYELPPGKSDQFPDALHLSDYDRTDARPVSAGRNWGVVGTQEGLIMPVSTRILAVLALVALGIYTYMALHSHEHGGSGELVHHHHHHDHSHTEYQPVLGVEPEQIVFIEVFWPQAGRMLQLDADRLSFYEGPVQCDSGTGGDAAAMRQVAVVDNPPVFARWQTFFSNMTPGCAHRASVCCRVVWTGPANRVYAGRHS